MRPAREVATNNGQTYFVTSNTAERRRLFRYERWADLFVETLCGYRPEKFALHAFTLMPDHFRVLITLSESLEKSVQFIKGGFSFKAKRAFDWKLDVSAAGYSDHRIRGDADYEGHLRYIDRNAVKARRVEREHEHRSASASGLYAMDAFPRGLKPQILEAAHGAAKAAPFQSAAFAEEAAPFQNKATATAKRQGNEN
jgi:putative transposase